MNEQKHTNINHFELYAALVSKKPLRYTPAGLPVQEVVLSHASEQGIEGIKRKIHFECLGVAFGGIALHLTQLQEHQSALFQGYWATQYGTRSRWMLHIHHFIIDHI